MRILVVTLALLVLSAKAQQPDQPDATAKTYKFARFWSRQTAQGFLARMPELSDSRGAKPLFSRRSAAIRRSESILLPWFSPNATMSTWSNAETRVWTILSKPAVSSGRSNFDCRWPGRLAPNSSKSSQAFIPFQFIWLRKILPDGAVFTDRTRADIVAYR